jgi:hypothetical protein
LIVKLFRSSVLLSCNELKLKVFLRSIQWMLGKSSFKFFGHLP